ncbi:MAG: hypothetical protein ABR924_03915 [Terracidiphilus sp.]
MKKSSLMPKTLDSPKPLTADEIADLADSEEDIFRFFTNAGKTMPPILPEVKEEDDDQED